MELIVSNCCGAKLLEIETEVCTYCKEHCEAEPFNGSNHYPHYSNGKYVYPLQEKAINDKELNYLIESLHPQFDSKKNIY
tara:strand:+ start:111 stop:350 length:240 start_codon:yes stop_codon:yes gene_type:complete